MPKGYVIARIVVHDKERFEQFKQMQGAVIAEYGGKILVRNPNPEVREGTNTGVAVILEFDSIETARKFYESEPYTKAKAVRESAADTELILVEGTVS